MQGRRRRRSLSLGSHRRGKGRREAQTESREKEGKKAVHGEVLVFDTVGQGLCVRRLRNGEQKGSRERERFWNELFGLDHR